MGIASLTRTLWATCDYTAVFSATSKKPLGKFVGPEQGVNTLKQSYWDTWQSTLGPMRWLYVIWFQWLAMLRQAN